MRKLFKRHRVRATFYHIVAFIFIMATWLWGIGFISDATSFYISATLFIVDYFAEMYDPNPEQPGPWFATHFHRFLDDDDDGDGEENTLLDDRSVLRGKFKEKGYVFGIKWCDHSPTDSCVYNPVKNPSLDDCIFCHDSSTVDPNKIASEYTGDSIFIGGTCSGRFRIG